MNKSIVENKIISKLNALDVDSLFDVLKKLAVDTRSEATFIFDKGLDILMSKTTEDQFINKMNELDCLILISWIL